MPFLVPLFLLLALVLFVITAAFFSKPDLGRTLIAWGLAALTVAFLVLQWPK